MNTLFFAGAVLAGLLTSGAAWADTDCHAPVQDWQPRVVLRQQVEHQGWQAGQAVLEATRARFDTLASQTDQGRKLGVVWPRAG